MKSSDSSTSFKPFKNLKSLLERKSFALKPSPPPRFEVSHDREINHRTEEMLFEEAMAGVKQISRENCIENIPEFKSNPNTGEMDDDETLRQLNNLVRFGTGFVVSLTSEYIEATGYQVNPEVVRRLHRGEFSIQAHIDLHGFTVKEARYALDKFLTDSISAGKRAVLVIHGRGLSSPARPILKTNVYRWLTSSPWHKWVIAFTSARLCDGGAGATYVLLRQRPLPKRFRKKRTHP
ncbi:MAG: Smr/MutS family protein [Desulfobacterales bacterium]|jgi:DNA-nicking Smr family endonuclease